MTEDHFKEILTELKNLKEQIAAMREDIERVEEKAKKMSDHIDFIETLWRQLRRPINYVFGTKIDKIKSPITSSAQELISDTI